MGHKLLLADDSITIQKVVSLTFAEEDFEVICVGNGEIAVEKIREQQPDIVLADIFMPRKTGYEVCAFVKTSERFRHIPVILLVGTFEPFDKAEAASVGADGFLTKPFEPTVLIRMVRQMLEKTKADRMAANLERTVVSSSITGQVPLPRVQSKRPAEDNKTVQIPRESLLEMPELKVRSVVKSDLEETLLASDVKPAIPDLKPDEILLPVGDEVLLAPEEIVLPQAESPRPPAVPETAPLPPEPLREVPETAPFAPEPVAQTPAPAQLITPSTQVTDLFAYPDPMVSVRRPIVEPPTAPLPTVQEEREEPLVPEPQPEIPAPAQLVPSVPEPPAEKPAPVPPVSETSMRISLSPKDTGESLLEFDTIVSRITLPSEEDILGVFDLIGIEKIIAQRKSLEAALREEMTPPEPPRVAARVEAAFAEEVEEPRHEVAVETVQAPEPVLEAEPEVKAAPLPAAAAQTEAVLDETLVTRIARMVVEKLSEKIIHEIAWEVVPELAELVIRQEVERMKREGKL
ncbi:MAG: response regulator [Acidobacteria bacterium]|nr:response regulator [Acidobacteriota bacterium]